MLALAAEAMFTGQPNLLTRPVLGSQVPDALRGSIGDTHSQGSKMLTQASFDAAAPADLAPWRAGQDRFGGDRPATWDTALTRASTSGHGKDQRHIRQIDFPVTREAHSPIQIPLVERLAKGSAQAIAGLGHNAAEADAGCPDPVNLGNRDLRLGRQAC